MGAGDLGPPLLYSGGVMPFKSQAQRRKFQELVAKGEMKPEVYQEWENATRGKKLPERITPKKPPRRHKIK